MANAILEHFRQLIHQDMERRLKLNFHLFKTHSLIKLILKYVDTLDQLDDQIKDCLHLLGDYIGKASRDNDFALSELANKEHLYNDSIE